ncbi:MAG: RNA 2',3'-cyclic phosphodiesterase [Nitrospirales bacterium]
MSIRVFLAIDLNSTVREALNLFQEQTDAILPIKWVSSQSMHLTIKFLGDIQKDQVMILQETLRGVVKIASPFSLTIKGLGGFPSLQKPRILWAGVFGEVDQLNRLVACVELALSPLGFTQEDRPYYPHLTLSRIKTHSREIGKIITTSDVFKKERVFGEVPVNRLYLFQSQLTPKGAIYSKLWDVSLGGNVNISPSLVS